MPRFFVAGTLACEQECELAGADGHKVRNVLRLREGDAVELRDSVAAAFEAVVTRLRPEVRLRVERHLANAVVPSDLEVTLAQCLPKGAKMDYVVEKATELGVRRIVPVRSERVVGAHEGEGKLERWRRLARAAAQQSGAPRVPEIGEMIDWCGLLAGAAAYDRVVIPWELADGEPRAFDRLLTGVRKLLIVIGPEGGLSHAEVESARDHGCIAVSLGRQILRTETAGLVAVTCARYAVGEV